MRIRVGHIEFRGYCVRSFLIDIVVIVALFVLIVNLRHASDQGSTFRSALDTGLLCHLAAFSTGSISLLVPEAGRSSQPIKPIPIPVHSVDLKLPHLFACFVNNNSNAMADGLCNRSTLSHALLSLIITDYL